MKKLVCLLFVLSVSCCASALDRQAFTFTKYDLNVRVEPEQERLGVRGKITLRNDSNSPQREITLQISSSLHWSAIQFQGKPVEYVTQPYISDIDHTGALSEAIVVLPQAVAPKQSIELEIGYEGVIPLDPSRLTRIGVPEESAKHTDWDQISKTFTAVRGIGYVTWYPIATDAASLADNSTSQAVDDWDRREGKAEMNANMCVLNASTSPTLLMNDIPAEIPAMSAGGTNDSSLSCTSHYFPQLGLVPPLFVIGNYSILTNSIADIRFLSDHKPGADDYSSAIDEVSPLLTKWIGDHRKNSQQKANVVDLLDSQSAPYDAGNMLLIPLTGPDTKFLLAAAQQLTHLFFPSSHAWIHDGLANYIQARFIEEKEGRQAAMRYMQAHRSAVVHSEKLVGAKHNGTPLINASHETLAQTKAMFVWWMLRDIVGDRALQNALFNYKERDDSNPDYMQKLIQTQSHSDLQWFFDDWVYHDRGLPDFRIDSVFSSALPSGGYMVTVSVENLGDAGAGIPVILNMQDGEKSDRLIVHGKSKASIRIEAPSWPQSVTVSDGSVPETDMSNNEYKVNH
ncbi:MAG TPA: hypothetical protein VFA90_01870 [Terriglobales bacterium]|nr:hypothetical protein [Terriglobales bacterium]